MDVETLFNQVKHAHALVLVAAVIFIVSFVLPVIDIMPGASISGLSAATKSFQFLVGGPDAILGSGLTEWSGQSSNPTIDDRYVWVASAWALNIELAPLPWTV